MKKQSLKDFLQRAKAKLGVSRREFLKASAAATAVATGVTALGSNLLTKPALAAAETAAQSAAPNATAIDIWTLPAFTPATGMFKPDSTWTTIAQQYRFPDWYRDAKYGIWQHWSPQSVPEDGDWYALRMYQQGTSQYKYHLAHYGHPSKFGYKDITHLFTGSQWNPTSLLELYVQQGGAKFFVALANHHDNYDNWDSTYQPWNSQTVGRKSDIIGEWATAARAQGVPFGVTYHACPGPAWGFFMAARYGHDTSGAYANVPYDGVLTAADGKGLWWDGLDPQDLNGYVHDATGYMPSESDPFTRQFYWRIDDLITKHKPDLLYFDDSINPMIANGGVDWSLQNEAYVIAANYYNKALQWNGGKQHVVLNFKHVPTVALGAVVQDYETTIASSIQNYPWQAENTLGPWHYYAPDPITMTADTVIHDMVNAVSKNGTYLINVPQHGDGHLDPLAITIVQQVGAWLKTNGEAIHSTRPFAVFGEGSFFYTRTSVAVYAIATAWPTGTTFTLTNLKKGSPYIGNVTKVELLGHSGTLGFSQTTSGLTITLPTSFTTSQAYAFKVTHDKPLVNNDESGFTYTGNGWIHVANRGLGDSNNNIHSTTINGDSVSYTFTGTGIDYISETYTDEGNVDVYIDGVFKKTVSGYSATRVAQVTLYSITGLASGSHTIKLVKTSGTYMLLDAFRIHP
jgi:alpha-L-fucosidase